MTINVIGDSHVHILREAWDKRAKHLPLSFHGRHGFNWFRPDVSQNPDGTLRVYANRQPNSAALDITIDPSLRYVLSAPLHSATVVVDATWKTICPWNLWESLPDRLPISDQSLISCFRFHTEGHHRVVRLWREAGVDLAIIEPPRPLRRLVSWNKTSPDLIIYIDNAFRGHVREELAALDVPVIAVPPETVDEDGFTAAQFEPEALNDPHHGGLAFGDVMIKQIEQHFSL